MQATAEKNNFLDLMAKRFSLQGFIFAITLTFFLVSILFPFYWMVTSSFKTRAEIGGREPVYVPAALRLEAYSELLDPENESFQNFGVNILNTIKVAIPTAAIAIVLAVFGSYAIARLKFKGKNLMVNAILIVYLFPGILLIIPSLSIFFLASCSSSPSFPCWLELGIELGLMCRTILGYSCLLI